MDDMISEWRGREAGKQRVLYNPFQLCQTLGSVLLLILNIPFSKSHPPYAGSLNCSRAALTPGDFDIEG
jgi:hypothetical protein